MLSEQLDDKSIVQMLRKWGLLLAMSIFSLMSVFYADLQLYFLGFGLALGVLLLVYFRPEVGLAILFFLTADVLHVNQFIDLRALGGGFELRDLFLVALWGIVLLRYRPVCFKRVLGGPLAIWLLVFLGGALFSAAWALLRFSVEVFYVLRELRAIASYSTFFLLLLIVRDRRRFDFVVHYLTFLACLVAMISVLQYLMGTEFAFAGGRVEVRAATQGLTRVLLPSSFLVNVMMIVNIAQLSFNHGTKSLVLRVPIIVLLGTAVALTQSRNLWFSDAMVLLLLFMISGLRKKVRFVLIVSLFGLLLGLGLGLLPGANGDVTTVEGLLGRLTEPFERDLFQGSRSLGGRVQELQIAWGKIVQYPLLGIGVGNRYYEYTRRVWRYSDILNFLPWFIHNGYAWIALKMGLPISFFFLCLLVKVLVLAGHNFYNAGNKRDRGIAAGLALSFIGLCASALVVPVFMQPSHVVTFMAVVGLIAAFRRLSLSNELTRSAR